METSGNEWPFEIRVSLLSVIAWEVASENTIRKPEVAACRQGEISARGDPFIGDLGIVTTVVNDQILGPLAFRVGDECVGVPMLSEHRHGND
jgi:hypothetical protein